MPLPKILKRAAGEEPVFTLFLEPEHLVFQGHFPGNPILPGVVQVPPSGLPTVLLADGPVTGGYPVIAVVAAASLDLLAQARPGERLVFRRALP